MPATVSYAPVGILLIPALILLIGFVLAIAKYHRTRTRGTLVAVLAFAAGAVVVGSVFAYAAYDSYRQQNTWTFGYSVTVQANGTAPEAIVVPAPTDETLLDGLQLTRGIANWSFVTTPHGRGLFVRFTGSAVLERYISRFPSPAVQPDASPTMAQPSNCTTPSSNCTGFPMYWMYYSGGAGALVSVSLSWASVVGYVRPGWAAYPVTPHPVA